MKIRICMSCGEITEFIGDKTLDRVYVKGGLCKECAEVTDYTAGFLEDEAALFKKYSLLEEKDES